jgi:hypothetical protein
MKTETFEFVIKAIDRYGEWFFNFDDLFEDSDEGKDYYYYPTFRYCHHEDTKKTDAIMVKNETPLWLCCMQAIRESDPNLDLNEILEDMKYLKKEYSGRGSIILY